MSVTYVTSDKTLSVHILSQNMDILDREKKSYVSKCKKVFTDSKFQKNENVSSAAFSEELQPRGDKDDFWCNWCTATAQKREAILDSKSDKSP